MNVQMKPFALTDFGLTDSIIVDGVGLATRGLAWTCGSDWLPETNVVTIWAQPSNVTTIWATDTNPIFGDDC